MIVLIPDLDQSTTPEDLHEYVAGCMKSVWLVPIFRRKGRLEKCEILRIKDPDNDQVQHQGLVYVDDEATGAALIKQLSGCRFFRKTLKPRIYHQRSRTRERRVNLVDSEDIAIFNRRRSDRRRQNLLIERVVSSLPLSTHLI